MSSSVAGRESARSLEEDEDAVKSEKTTASWFSSQRRTKDFKMQDAKPCGMSWGQAEERKRNFTGGVLRYVATKMVVPQQLLDLRTLLRNMKGKRVRSRHPASP